MEKENLHNLRYKNTGRDKVLQYRKREELKRSRKDSRLTLCNQRRPLASCSNSENSPLPTLNSKNLPKLEASTLEASRINTPKRVPRCRLAEPLAVRKARLQEWKALKEEKKRSQMQRPAFVFKKITYALPAFLTSEVKEERRPKPTALPRVYNFRSRVRQNIVADHAKQQVSAAAARTPAQPVVLLTRPSFAPDDFKFAGLGNHFIMAPNLETLQEDEELAAVGSRTSPSSSQSVAKKALSKPSLLYSPNMQTAYRTRQSVKADLMSFTPVKDNS